MNDMYVWYCPKKFQLRFKRLQAAVVVQRDFEKDNKVFRHSVYYISANCSVYYIAAK